MHRAKAPISPRRSSSRQKAYSAAAADAAALAATNAAVDARTAADDAREAVKDLPTREEFEELIEGKQDVLVSGETIKTINRLKAYTK